MSKHDDFVKACGDMTFPPVPPLDFPETPAIVFPADAPQDVTPQATAALLPAAISVSLGPVCAVYPKPPSCVLSNDEISDYVTQLLTPNSLCLEMKGEQPIGGFWGLAEEIGAAMRDKDMVWAEVQPEKLGAKEQIICALRAFYLLGVLRGLEQYRDHLLANNKEPTFSEITFGLDPFLSADFVENLRGTAPDLLDKLLALVGVSAPATDGKEAH